ASRKRSRRWTSGSSVGSGTEGRIVATLLLLLTPPMVSAALAALVRPYRRVVGWANAILALVSVGSALALWREVLVGRVVTSGPGELLRVDALSALLAFGVSVVGALAFAGTVLAYVDFVTIVGRQDEALNWPVLVAAAPLLDPEVMRLAFVFVLVGYGTKAGLAPMHTWLPDAHAEAPAPLSAMMSGVLLAVALYAVIRWEAVANAALGAAFTDRFLLGLGL